MISSTHFHDNGDGSAWWVPDFKVVTAKTWGRKMDRPCDTCGGKGYDSSVIKAADSFDGIPYISIHDCPDCFGTGRHAFPIEVGPTTIRKPHVTVYNEVRTLTVAVRPGIVLPIYSPDQTIKPSMRGDQRCIIITKSGKTLFWDGIGSFNLITLPTAAKPGMYAVNLDIYNLQGDT